MRRVDFIIAGLGLAGAALSLQLLKRGERVVVYDLPAENRSSRSAAGLFTPVTGKLISRTWKADALFPYLDEFYREAERLVRRKFFFPSPIYIPLGSVEEQNDWVVRGGDEYHRNFVTDVFTKSQFGSEVNDPFGGILLRRGGHINPREFLDGVQELLVTVDSFMGERLDAKKLATASDCVRYGEVEAGALVFCDGMAAHSNHFFEWLPVLPLKGETLELKMPVQPGRIYNRGVYVVPSGEGLCKTGATYERTDASGTTEAARDGLVTRLQGILKLPFSVVRQAWGIRPTTPDRRPLIGHHPAHKNVLIFNGMGTKGVSLTPYFSGHLADYLMGTSQIEPEVNISRYNALYSKF